MGKNLALGKVASGGLTDDAARVLRNAFGAVGFMTLLSAGASAVAVAMQPGGGALAIAAIAMLVSVFGARIARQSAWGLLWLAIMSISAGLALAPALAAALSAPNGARAITLALLGSGAAVGGLSLYAARSKKDFSAWGAMLFVALLAVFVLGLANFLIASSALELALAGATILVFSGYVLFDVSSVVHGGETNYISAAVGIYLDVLNLFSAMLRVARDLS